MTRDRWPSIPELMDSSYPFRLTFWNAAQLHHFLQTIPNPQTYTRSLTTFEEYCSETEPLPQVLSKMYALLNTPPNNHACHALRNWKQTSTVLSPHPKNRIWSVSPSSPRYALKCRRPIIRFWRGGTWHPVTYILSFLTSQSIAG